MVNSADNPLSEQAYRRLRDDITRCVLAPGQPLSETQLAGMYGFGRTPIRSALTRLRHEGIVSSLPRRGHVVTHVTLRDVRDLFEFRLIVEPQAARLAAGRVDEDLLRRLDAAVEPGYVPGDVASQQHFLEANRRFHIAIADATGNRRLRATVEALLDDVTRVLHLGLSARDLGARFQHEHRDLIRALAEGDGQAAESLMYAAIRGGQEMVMEALISMPVAVEMER